jgi:hypothetical protein
MLNPLRQAIGHFQGRYRSNQDIVRHHDFDRFPDTVLLLNSIFQTRTIWQIMEQRLRVQNYGVVTLNLNGVFDDHRTPTLEHQALWLSRKIDRLFSKYEIQNLHIIGYGTGGLIARHLIQEYDDDHRVQSLCTLGTAHHSTPIGLAGWVLNQTNRLSPSSQWLKHLPSESLPSHLPITSIYSTKDWMTPWWCSVLRTNSEQSNLRNVQMNRIAHSDFTVDTTVFAEILQHLNQITTPATPQYK